MHTNIHAICRLDTRFRSETEARLLSKIDPNAFSRSRELDPRNSEEDLQNQNDFLTRYHVDRNRLNLSHVFGTDTIGKEGRLQLEDTRADSIAEEHEAQIRELLLTTDPKEFKDEVGERFRRQAVVFRTNGSMAGGAPVENINITIDYTQPVWGEVRTEAEIQKRLEACTNITQLNALGVTSNDPLFDHFSVDQAKAFAKLAMVQYARGLLATGMVGEANIRQAQFYLRSNPKLMAKLEMHAEDKKTAKAKKDMLNLLDELKKINTRETLLNFADTVSEHGKILVDLQPKIFDAPISVFTSDHFKARYPVGSAGIAATDKKEERREADARKKDLDKDMTYYRQMSDLLERIHTQMGKIDGMTWPTTTSAAPLFSAGTLQRDKLEGKTNPGLISDDLKTTWPELAEEADHGHDHKEAPKGVRAVVEIYAEHFKDEAAKVGRDLSDDDAKTQAYRTFFRNEMSKIENDMLEEEIERATGGRLTITQGIAQGIGANLKAPFVGSDEAFICRIAESPEVGIPTAVGTAATTWRHKALEGATISGVSAGIGAGVGALGATVPSALALTGTGAAIGGGLLAAGTGVGSFILGMGMAKACADNASKARSGWKKFGWGLGSAASFIGGVAVPVVSGVLGITGLASTAVAAGSLAVSAAPIWAVGAGAGLLGYGALKLTGLDRRLFGTRTLGFFQPRQGARPAWGELKKDRRKLKIVWNAMLRGLREGKLSNSWYVKSQVKEVGRLMLMALADETSENMVLGDMKEEDWKDFSMANKRVEMQRQIQEMVRYGAAGTGEDVDEALVVDSKKAEILASSKQAGWRRSLWRNIKGPLFGAYDEPEKKHDDSDKPSHTMAA